MLQKFSSYFTNYTRETERDDFNFMIKVLMVCGLKHYVINDFIKLINVGLIEKESDDFLCAIMKGLEPYNSHVKKFN